MRIINKVGLAVFEDKKILMVRTNDQDDIFYTLGGKIKEGESDIDCLKREVWEEIGCQIDESSLKYLATFEDVAHGVKAMLHLKLYAGKLQGQPKPLSEVVEIGYFDINSDKKHLSLVAQRTLFPWLKQHGYIN